MADFKKMKLLRWRGSIETGETRKLDAFLSGAADPGLLRSLQQEDKRRTRFLALAALIAGVLLGSTGFWLASSPRKPEVAASAQSADETARILVSHGQALSWSKQLPKAWSYLRLATELSPRLVEAWDALGISLLFGGQAEAAAECFRHCLAIEPGYERGFHGLGDIHFYSGRHAEAESYWLKAHAYRAVSRVRLLQGRMEEAAPLVHRLVAERPDDPWLKVMSQAVAGGELSPDLRWRLEPGYLATWNPEAARGWRLYYEERYNEASAVFGRVLARNPGEGSAMLGKGWCLLKIGSHLEARPYFERVLAKWPANYSAMNGLGWCLKAEGQAEGALKAWERLWQLRTDTLEAPEALKGMGMVYYERGDYQRANFYLAQCVLRNSEDEAAAELLQETAEKLSPP